jgi:FkbM family methyltransferase
MRLLKQAVKKFINAAGFDLRRITPNSSSACQLLRGLERFDIDVVFDVGANTGQFASELRTVGYSGTIVSFEPLSDAFESLTKHARSDVRWQIHPRCAIGDFDGEIDINISGNSVSSSVLPMMEAHSGAAEQSAYVGAERVPIFRFDSAAAAYLSESSRYLIKIDAQGFEWQVLDGTGEMLRGAQGVLCELSLVPLYEGQRLWQEIIQRLEREGFTLWSIQNGFTDSRDGRTLQIDGIFFREN